MMIKTMAIMLMLIKKIREIKSNLKRWRERSNMRIKEIKNGFNNKMNEIWVSKNTKKPKKFNFTAF